MEITILISLLGFVILQIIINNKHKILLSNQSEINENATKVLIELNKKITDLENFITHSNLSEKYCDFCNKKIEEQCYLEAQHIYKTNSGFDKALICFNCIKKFNKF